MKDELVLDPSLVLWLPFRYLDGGSFMSRDAIGHECTNYGSLWTSQGRSFDGTDDYVDCGNDESLDITDAITIEAWFNMSNVNSVIIKRYTSLGGSNRGGWQLNPQSDGSIAGYVGVNDTVVDEVRTTTKNLNDSIWPECSLGININCLCF